MQSNERAKDDHDRAQARAKELDLAIGLVPARQYTLTKLDELPHRFLLELQPQILEINLNPIKGRIAIQHFVSLENVGVLHRKDVRRSAPFTCRQRQRRRISRIRPRARSR